MYNGNHTQLSLFRSATGVSFPLLQMAVNGTLYGAFRDEMMVIDQTGKQTLLVDVRSDANWRTKVTAEIDRLISIPVPRILDARLQADSLSVGETAILPFTITNSGGGPLVVRSVSSDLPGFSSGVSDLVIAAGDTVTVNLTVTPTEAGTFAADVVLSAPGALNPTLTVPAELVVLAPPVPRLVTTVSTVSLGEIEAGRLIPVSIPITNDGNAELTVSADNPADGLTATETARIAPMMSGTFRAHIRRDTSGPFDVTLRLGTNDPDRPTLEVQVTGSVIVIPADVRADFDGSGSVDFADFLFFASSFGTSEPKADLDGSGVVDFADFLVFAGSFGKTLE